MARRKTGGLLTPLRKRTLVIPSAKGGASKTTLAAHLAYEFTRYGLTVLCIDTDSLGGFTSLMKSYAGEGQSSSLEVIKGEIEPQDAAIMVPGWTAPSGVSWQKGGALIEGGQTILIPAPADTARQSEFSREMEKPGSVEEMRLARALNAEAFHSVDVIIVDMPGTSSPTIVNSVLNAAANVVYPAKPEYLALQGIQAIDDNIDRWIDNSPDANAYLNTLGAIPTQIDPGQPGRRTPGKEVLEETERWLQSNEGNEMRLFAPGIEERSAMRKAVNIGVPIQRMTETQGEIRDTGTIPPAFARIALSILEEINEANDEELYDVEGMKSALESQVKKLQITSKKIRDRWKSAILSEKFMKLVENDGN